MQLQRNKDNVVVYLIFHIIVKYTAYKLFTNP